MGIKPLASQTDVLPHLQDRLEGITILGWPLNLEKVTALNPDLIIGSADGEETQTYDLLSQIAPTVLADLEISGDWKQMVRFVGEVLGEPAAATEVLNNYDQRIDQLKQKMEARAQNLEISVIRLYPEKITLYQKDSFIGRILDDAGLKRPPSQQLSADQALAAADNPIQVSISKELLEKADGDVIFVVTYSYHKQRERELKTRMENLKTDPLWSHLEAVQRDRVYPVGSHWIVSGPLAANAVIDDLFHYLIEEESSQ
jgi:iron complex transport system substrate-binding protein